MANPRPPNRSPDLLTTLLMFSMAPTLMMQAMGRPNEGRPNEGRPNEGRPNEGRRMIESKPSTLYTIRDVPGKGKAVFATEAIPKGTRILSEEPAIKIPKMRRSRQWLSGQIFAQVDHLSDDQRRSLLSMRNHFPFTDPPDEIRGIILTNARAIDEGGIAGALFLDACLINHACDSNAHKKWNNRIGRYTIHAVRDIAEGEEITIYYLDLCFNREQRQQRLWDKFQLKCSCRLCSLPTEESKASDARLERISELDDLIVKDGLQSKSPLRTLRYADERVRLYVGQGPCDGWLPRAYLDAHHIAVANGDLARGQVFAERAIEEWKVIQGSDCKEVITFGHLVRNPDTDRQPRHSKKWQTSLDEIPTEMEPEDFEDWLWRREKLKQLPDLGQPTNLRNRAIFPSFNGVPISDTVDLNFFEKFEGDYRQTRHWCFLGEVAEATVDRNFILNLRDIDNRLCGIRFDIFDSRGSEGALSQLKVGNTVAVLYAQRQYFVHENKYVMPHSSPRMLKIYPIGLQALLSLNDLLQRFSKDVDGFRPCHGCGKAVPSARRCAECKAFSYCDKACQKVGWLKNKHRETCKSLLRSPVLRGLFAAEWDVFHKQLTFPLPGTWEQ